MAGLSASFTDGHDKYAILAAFAGSRVQAATDILLPFWQQTNGCPVQTDRKYVSPESVPPYKKTLRFYTPFLSK